MRKKLWIGLALLLVIPGLFFTASCAKKTVKSDASVSEVSGAAPSGPAASTDKATSDEVDKQRKEAEKQQELERQRRLEEERLRAQKLREKQMEEQRRKEEVERKMAEAAKRYFLTELILFDFDSSVLTPAAQDRLRGKAQWLKDNPNASVIIEGHCDERGTNEYNLALGERRAEAAKAFLIDMGISATRMATISYGEERPFAKGHDEDAWSLNRRAHFVLE